MHKRHISFAKPTDNRQDFWMAIDHIAYKHIFPILGRSVASDINKVLASHSFANRLQDGNGISENQNSLYQNLDAASNEKKSDSKWMGVRSDYEAMLKAMVGDAKTINLAKQARSADNKTGTIRQQFVNSAIVTIDELRRMASGDAKSAEKLEFVLAVIVMLFKGNVAKGNDSLGKMRDKLLNKPEFTDLLKKFSDSSCYALKQVFVACNKEKALLLQVYAAVRQHQFDTSLSAHSDPINAIRCRLADTIESSKEAPIPTLLLDHIRPLLAEEGLAIKTLPNAAKFAATSALARDINDRIGPRIKAQLNTTMKLDEEQLRTLQSLEEVARLLTETGQKVRLLIHQFVALSLLETPPIQPLLTDTPEVPSEAVLSQPTAPIEVPVFTDIVTTPSVVSLADEHLVLDNQPQAESVPPVLYNDQDAALSIATQLSAQFHQNYVRQCKDLGNEIQHPLPQDIQTHDYHVATQILNRLIQLSDANLAQFRLSGQRKPVLNTFLQNLQIPGTRRNRAIVKTALTALDAARQQGRAGFEQAIRGVIPRSHRGQVEVKVTRDVALKLVGKYQADNENSNRTYFRNVETEGSHLVFHYVTLDAGAQTTQHYNRLQESNEVIIGFILDRLNLKNSAANQVVVKQVLDHTS